ncbi:MAG: hypothetical protein JWM33_544 [Caulobacteraceae bacterium]|nr:hypothetical protein [Caulobacteraceae bacterium]
MSFSAARPLTPWQWLGLPTLSCILAAIVFAAPVNIYGFQLPQPVFPLAPAFAWAVIRPSLMAPFALLLLGVLFDLFWGGPLGLWPISLLAAYGVALFCRSIIIGQGQLMSLAWYAGACALAMFVASLVTMAEHHAAPGFFPLLWQFLATLVLYPLADRLIQRFDDADVRFR